MRIRNGYGGKYGPRTLHGFFRNDEKLEQLTPDDRIEIFLNVLLGSSDIDVKLLNELLNNYDISNIVISEK